MSDPFSGVEAFVATATQRSFRGAAEELGVTSPAVSKAVSRLEDELGVRLLDRTTRRVELTAAGRLFVSHCEEALMQMRVARHRIEQARVGATGDLVVALPFILGPSFLKHLPQFVQRYPGLQVRLTFSDRMTRMVDEQIDVALRIGPLGNTTAISRKLMSTRWLTVASPGYLARRGAPRTIEELAVHDCAAYRSPRGVVVDWEFASLSGAGSKRRVSVEPRIVLDQGQLLVDAAVAGAGLVHVMDFMVREELEKGSLVCVLSDLECAGPALHALCKPGHQKLPKVRAMFDFVRDEYATLARSRR